MRVLAVAALVAAVACGHTERDPRGASEGAGEGGAADRPTPGAGASRGGTEARGDAQAGGDSDGADGGSGGMSSEAAAGVGGEGPAEVPGECDVVVPRDTPDLDSAIASVTPPALVCLQASILKPTSDTPFAMRDGVSLRGLHRERSVVCGSVDVSAAQDLGISLESLVVAGAVRGQTAVALALRDVSINGGHPDCVLNPSGAAVEIRYVDPVRTLTLTVESARFSGPGLLIASADQQSLMRMEVLMVRSACFSKQCWDLARFDLGQLPTHSRISIGLENNIVQNSVLEAIGIFGQLLAPADGDGSFVRIVNNTIYAAHELNYGIFVADNFGAPVVAANNAIGNLMTPIVGPVDEFSNRVASSGAADWFVDADAGNLVPAPASALRGGADPDYMPSHDFAGNQRSGRVIGALE